MDDKTSKLFEDFKLKNTIEYVESLYCQIDQYIPSKITRLTNLLQNQTCNACKKKAIYTNNIDGTLLCWKHGNELVKNN
jgi:hypothetical protein